MKRGNPAGMESPGLENVFELRLMAVLTDLVRRHGRTGTALMLGIDRKTLWRSQDAGRLSPALTLALEKMVREGDDEAAADQRGITVALERRVAELEGKLDAGLRQVHVARAAIEEQAEGAAEGFARQLGEVERRLAEAETALREGRMAPRDGDVNAEVRHGVVRLEAGADQEEEDYGAAAPLVAEWRRLYGGGVDEGDRVERALAEERMRRLEIELIEDHGLTLPPAKYPWTEGDRRSEVRSRKMTLERVRSERIRAQWRRRLRRWLTLGRWR